MSRGTPFLGKAQAASILEPSVRVHLHKSTLTGADGHVGFVLSLDSDPILLCFQSVNLGGARPNLKAYIQNLSRKPKTLGLGCIWNFPKIKGTFWGGPYNKGYSILGSILGSPYFGKPPYTLGLSGPTLRGSQARRLAFLVGGGAGVWVSGFRL